MTLQELQTKANTKLQEFWDALVVRQEAYRLKHDNYFQLLISDSVVDGVDTTWVIRYAPDQPEVMRNDVQFTFNSPVPFQIEVTPWGTKPNRGFIATATVELPNGTKYRRSRSYTDTRTRVQDVVSGSEETGDLVLTEPYLAGDAPLIETTPWEQVFQQTV